MAIWAGSGFDNYVRFVSSSAFWPTVQTTLIIVGGVLVITMVLGVLLALLLDQPMWGQGVVRILVIAPFFVMPTVSALVWKNMFLDSSNGLLAHIVAGIWSNAGRVAFSGFLEFNDPDCQLAVVAFCHAYPTDRSSIT